MSIVDIRFRNEGGKVVLQVCEKEKLTHYGYHYDQEWRDAKVEDMLAVAEHLRWKYAPHQTQIPQALVDA